MSPPAWYTSPSPECIAEPNVVELSWFSIMTWGTGSVVGRIAACLMNITRSGVRHRAEPHVPLGHNLAQPQQILQSPHGLSARSAHPAYPAHPFADQRGS